MMLFVGALKGKVNHISLHRAGVDYTPRKRDGAYPTEFGVFDVTVTEDDEVSVTLDGQAPDEATKANDLWRFTFGVDPVDTETETLGIVVAETVGVAERVGG